MSTSAVESCDQGHEQSDLDPTLLAHLEALPDELILTIYQHALDVRHIPVNQLKPLVKYMTSANERLQSIYEAELLNTARVDLTEDTPCSLEHIKHASLEVGRTTHAKGWIDRLLRTLPSMSDLRTLVLVVFWPGIDTGYLIDEYADALLKDIGAAFEGRLFVKEITYSPILDSCSSSLYMISDHSKTWGSATKAVEQEREPDDIELWT